MFDSRVRKIVAEWRIEEGIVEGFVTQLKQTGGRIDLLTELPEDVKFYEAGVRETPGPGSGYRYVYAVYEARER
jgi:hypothetical protein